MRFTFISRNGDILPLAQQVEQEGSDVDMFVCSSEGLVVDKHIMDRCPDVIVFDSPIFGNVSHRLKASGFSVLGCSMFSERLASDDFYEMSVLKLCGLPVEGKGDKDTIKVITEGWFNGKGFYNVIYSIDSIVFPGSKEDKLYRSGLAHLESAIRKAGYCGPVSLMATISVDGVSFSDLRASFAVSTLLAIREGMKGRASDLLAGLSGGVNRAFMFKPGWFALVELVLNPSRLLDGDYYDIQIDGLTSDCLKHVWLYGVSGKSNHYVGRGGRIAAVTARGETVREARRRVYRTINNLVIPGLLYQNKVGDETVVQHSRLKSGKWIS